MTVDDLREILEDLDGNMEVRIAMQPNWPFEYSIDDAKLKSEVRDEDDDEDDEDNKEQDFEDESDREVLYLTEGRQLGYTSKRLWD